MFLSFDRFRRSAFQIFLHGMCHPQSDQIPRCPLLWPRPPPPPPVGGKGMNPFPCRRTWLLSIASFLVHMLRGLCLIPCPFPCRELLRTTPFGLVIIQVVSPWFLLRRFRTWGVCIRNPRPFLCAPLSFIVSEFVPLYFLRRNSYCTGVVSHGPYRLLRTDLIVGSLNCSVPRWSPITSVLKALRDRAGLGRWESLVNILTSSENSRQSCRRRFFHPACNVALSQGGETNRCRRTCYSNGFSQW